MFFIREQRTHTYSNGFQGFFAKQKRKPYIFQWVSMFFHVKTMEHIHIPMVFQVFDVLGSLGKQRTNVAARSDQDFPGPQKPGKPLEYVWFSLILNENAWKTIGICRVFVFALWKAWGSIGICMVFVFVLWENLEPQWILLYLLASGGSHVCSFAKLIPMACIEAIWQDQCLCDIKDALPPFAC